jgi:putative ABC transport system permease protein
MFKSFLKVAIRNIKRQKIYALINIAGLAIGIASSILITAFIIYEVNYDNFHEKRDRILRLYLKGKFGDFEFQSAWTASPAAAALINDFPEVTDATRIEEWDNVLIRYEDKTFLEDKFLWADSSFFNIFSFNLIQGNASTVLNEPNTIVISEEMAEKYFGKDDPVDNVLKIFADTTHYRVTGVFQKVPGNSHIDFDFVASYTSLEKANETEWLTNNLCTYILLSEDANRKDLELKMPVVVRKYAVPEIEQHLGISFEEWQSAGNNYEMALQPLKDIHLNTEIAQPFKPSNDKKYIYIFSIIAIFLIVIACINFMNLATARSAGRSKEVGMRKVVGSDKNLLIKQFLFESFFLTFLALIIGILMVWILLPHFNNLINLDLQIDYLGKWYIIPGLLLLGFLVGLLAGSYPAFFLASFKPVTVLTGKLKTGTRGGLLRSILVVIQFGISVFIILGTIVIYQQINFMLNKDLGFDKDQILVIRRFSEVGKNHMESFKQEISRIPGVMASASSRSVPGYDIENTDFFLEGRPANQTNIIQINYCDFDFAKTYGLRLINGRFLSHEIASDSTAAVINHTTVRNLNLKDPLSNRFVRSGDIPEERIYRQVVGVVEDFHFESLHSAIRPYMFILRPAEWGWIPYLSIRFDPANVNKVISEVEKVWEEYTNHQPFEYFFIDDDFANRYAEEQRTRTVFVIFSILAVVIACLGLFGLAAFTAEQRTKEIGIRKVMGASVLRIIALISRETLILLGIATIIALPLGWYFTRSWLNGFAYRIDLTIVPFVLSFILAIVIALLTVSYQTISAAMKNPAESLRYE